MKLKKLLALSTATVMAFSMVGCGSKDADTNTDSNTDNNAAGTETGSSDSTGDGELSYANLKLGEDYTDLTAEIKVLTNRTDLLEDDAEIPYQTYIDAFNKLYPNIKVDVEGITNYADDTLLRLQGGDWGDVMMIPAVDKADLSTYFMSLGTEDEMKSQINYYNQNYDGEVYGVPYTAGVNGGIVYNKAVFEEAGITEVPTTPEDFIAALQKIKDNTDAIPLYTNYAAGWAMGGQWDPAISGSATGDSTYMNQKLLHASNPFADPGDGTGAYNVYKVLYDAVANGLTEDDYSTTDWEGSKGMINNGEIACMVLGSWAVPQMQQAGDHADDIAYMPFPITLSTGKQCASVGPDYSFGINADASDDNKAAALCFVKFMTEQSGFSYDCGGLPIAAKDTKMPDFYAAFADIDFVVDEPALEGEEDLLNELNADSGLNVNNSGEEKLQEVVECAADGSKSFDDIMTEWDEKWTTAQENCGATE